MEWTREQRYRKYKDWDAQTLLNLQAQAATSPYQMHYHIHPLSGIPSILSVLSIWTSSWS